MKQNWIEIELGKILKTTSGGTPSRRKQEYYNGEIPWVKSGELNYNLILDTEEHISEEAIKKSSAKIFPKGTLLIALYGATIGKLAFLGTDAATNQAVCGIFKNEFVDTKFLYYYLFHNRRKLIEQGTGGAQPNISQTILKKLPLVIPPLPIQRAIVAKIEQLFSELDNGIQYLQQANQKIAVFRQAVLKKAFEGEYDNQNLIKNVVDKVQIGPFGSQLHKSDYINNQIPLINPMHIKNGKIKPSINYTISIQKRDSLPNYILKEGDVIMGRRGEMGRCALVSKNEDGWLCGTGSLFLRPDLSQLLPNYLNKYLQSALVKELLLESATGTTMMNLNKKIINNLPVPVPSLEVQHRIVQEIESRLSVCDEMEKSIASSLEKAEALRQSILKKAFSGELLTSEEIEQCKKEADWETAEELLERIEEENKKMKNK